MAGNIPGLPLSCGQMMPSETTSSAHQDEAAVTAVKRGDPERYRELVERHERRVFAVAWSRLGDATLAEEVTQEAFIRAYRRLWLLGDGAKFSGWINTIARRLAINLGLRHRRELNRRQRWVLENPGPAATDRPAETADPDYTPETLRQTLAELPPVHRECLVLFYLEGKSGAEAAAALGITESALRVRLHRARAAMRERLEDKLEGSLSKLGPAKTLVPAIMAGVLASTSAKAATAGGAGAAILGALAKFSPFKWLFLFVPLVFPLVPILPGLFFQLWRRRDEQRNFRDPAGFRASLHRQFGGGWLRAFLGLLMVIMIILLMETHHIGGRNAPFLLIGLFSLVTTGAMARKLEVNWNWRQIGLIVSGLFMAAVCLVVWLGRLPTEAIFIACVASTLTAGFSNRNRVLRMDCNLFLRAAQGMLRTVDRPVRQESPAHFDRPALRAFARFLAESELVFDFRWGRDGLTLFLPAVGTRQVTIWSRIFPSTGNTSSLVLGWNGSVAGHCAERDAAELAALPGNSISSPAVLEPRVAMAVAAAWQNFRAGNLSAAMRSVGQIPESEIFIVPPARTRARRVQAVVLGGLMIVSAALFGVVWLFPENLSGMKPVSVSEAQVRAFLNDTTPNPDPKKYKFNSPDLATFSCLVLPPASLFSPEGLQAMRTAVLQNSAWDTNLTVQASLTKQARVRSINYWIGSQMEGAILAGWLDWNDLGIQPQDYAAALHRPRNPGNTALQSVFDHLLTSEKAWSWVDEESWDVERISLFSVDQLRWLRAVNCLDLVDREKLIRQIAAVQDLSATPSAGQPVLHDWRDVRGLFFTPCWPALQDTYYSLAALEILGGLDRIDREACIDGILRRHRGRGYFTSPDSGSINEYHIDGSARDTIAAFESLRILGALDRVKDLDRWQFRVASYRASKPDASGVRTLTWDEVEAWVCQQRLEKILRERRENPSAPVHSLLEP